MTEDVQTKGAGKKKRVRALMIKGGRVITQRHIGSVGTVSAPKEKSGGISSSQQLRRSSDPRKTGTFGEQEIIEPPYVPGELAELIDRETTHGACCTAAAADVASRGYDLLTLEGVSTDDEKVKEARKEVENFLQGNFSDTPHMSFYEFVRMLILDYKSVGWASAEVLRRADGRMGGLRYVQARTIRVKADGQLYVQLDEGGKNAVHFIPYGKRIRLTSDDDENDGRALSVDEILGLRKKPQLEFDEDWMIDPASGDNIRNAKKKPDEDVGVLNSTANELIFIPCRHPATTYYGIPEGLKSMSAILGSIRLNDFNLDFLCNKGIPRWVLMLTGMDAGGEGEEDEDEESEDVALTNFIQTYLGEQVADTASPSALVMMIPDGVTAKWQRLSDEVKEGSFHKQSVVYRNQILTAHHTPPRRLGIVETAHLGAGTGYSQWEQYKYAVVQPLKQVIAGWINRIIREGMLIPYFNFRFKEFDIRDEAVQSEIDSRYLDRGVISVNDVLERMPGMEPVSGGEVRMRRGVDWTPVVGGDEAGDVAQGVLTRAIREIDNLSGADRPRESTTEEMGDKPTDKHSARALELDREAVTEEMADHLREVTSKADRLADKSAGLEERLEKVEGILKR